MWRFARSAYWRFDASHVLFLRHRSLCRDRRDHFRIARRSGKGVGVIDEQLRLRPTIIAGEVAPDWREPGTSCPVNGRSSRVNDA
jgi:hypothetical protein